MYILFTLKYIIYNYIFSVTKRRYQTEGAQRVSEIYGFHRYMCKDFVYTNTTLQAEI